MLDKDRTRERRASFDRLREVPHCEVPHCPREAVYSIGDFPVEIFLCGVCATSYRITKRRRLV